MIHTYTGQGWHRLANHTNVTVSFDDFLNFDNIPVSGILTHDEIVSNNIVQEEGDKEDYVDNVEPGTILMSAKKAANSVVQVRQFLKGIGITNSVYDALVVIKNTIDRIRWVSRS